jgi:NAD(P)-dependent dehydrogenase (short-subunit alcohol dehydrogenase family)
MRVLGSGYPGGSAYVSTKFAVEGPSESIAYELESFGIKVNFFNV